MKYNKKSGELTFFKKPENIDGDKPEAYSADAENALKTEKNEVLSVESKIENDLNAFSEKMRIPPQPKTEKSNVGDFDFSELKNINKEENLQIEKLHLQRADFEKSLLAMRKINFKQKIEFYEKQIVEIDLLIEKLKNDDLKILSTPVQIIEERAAILENESGMDKKEAEQTALSEVKIQKYQPKAKEELKPELIEYWKSFFTDEMVIRESDLVNKMLIKKELKINASNITLQLNEIFKAEQQGYIEHTNDKICSNHIYRKAV
jgi:hypothetical protein